MMLVGTLIAFPSAIVGLLFAIWIDRKMPVPMRPQGRQEDEPVALPLDKLPPLWLSLMPVLLPVVLIGAGRC